MIKICLLAVLRKNFKASKELQESKEVGALFKGKGSNGDYRREITKKKGNPGVIKIWLEHIPITFR